MLRSLLVRDQSSDPYSIIGRHRVEYSLCEVIGWRQPNLAPTEFRAKKALLPAEQRLEILREPEVDTKRVTPRCL